MRTVRVNLMALCLLQKSLDIASERRFFDYLQQHLPNLARNFLHDIQDQFKNCILIGDKGYRSHPWRLTLIEYAGIELNVPCRSNELVQHTMPADYARIRKRIEVIFSQLVDQMSIRKKYAKSQTDYFARIISKVTLFTLLQFINSQISRSLNHIRYTLAA